MSKKKTPVVDRYQQIIKEKAELDRTQVELELEKKRIESELFSLRRLFAENGSCMTMFRNEIVISQGQRCAMCEVPLRLKQIAYFGDCFESLYPDGQAYQVRLDVPVSRGGEEVESNLKAYCNECGVKKGTRTHDEFAEKQIEANEYKRRLAELKEARRIAVQHDALID